MNKIRIVALAAFFVPALAFAGAVLPPGGSTYAIQLNGGSSFQGQTNLYAFTESGSASTWGSDLNTFMAGLSTGSTVLLGTGTYNTQTSIIIPQGVTLKCAGKRATSIQASGSFPRSSSPAKKQAVVQLGNQSINFDSHIEDCGISGNYYQGSECLYIAGANEGTGYRNILCSNFDYYGVWFDGTTNLNINAGPFEELEVTDSFHTNAWAYGGGSGNRYGVYFNSSLSERIEMYSITSLSTFGSGQWNSTTAYVTGNEVRYVCSGTWHIFYALSGSTNVTPTCGSRSGTWSDTGQAFTAGIYIGGASTYANQINMHSVHCEVTWDCVSINGTVAGTLDTVDGWQGVNNSIVRLMSGSNFTGLSIRGIMNANGGTPYTIQDSVHSVNYTASFISAFTPAPLFGDLPTSCTSQPTGTVWNNSNVLNVCP